MLEGRAPDENVPALASGNAGERAALRLASGELNPQLYASATCDVTSDALDEKPRFDTVQQCAHRRLPPEKLL